MHTARRVLTSTALAGLLAVSGVACSSSKGGAGGDFCSKVRSYSKDKALNASNASDSKTINAFNDLASSAPSEIKPDMDLLKKVVNASAEIKKDPSKAVELAKTIDTAKMTTALSNIEKYAKDTCKVSITGT